MRLRQVAGAIMVVALAGCGTATSSSSAGHRGGAHPGASSDSIRLARQLGPPGGSPALARAVDRRMLASLVLPPGATRISPRSWPPRAGGLEGVNFVDVSRFFRLPQSPDAVYAFLNAHVPRGTKFSGDGSGYVPGLGSDEDVSYMLTSPPAGIEQDNMLDANLVADSRGGTLLRADGEVVWYPARSAAEFIKAAQFRVVTVTAGFWISIQRHVSRTKTFTSPAVISRIARLLNGLHAMAPRMVLSCPFNLPDVGVRFATAPGRRALVVVSAANCVGELVTVRGKPQPVLEDPGSTRLLTLVRSLLGLAHAHG